MRMAVELTVIAVTIFLAVMGEWLAAMLWQAGYIIGFHKGRTE